MKNNRKNLKIKQIIKAHILNNRKEYCIMLILFIIGIFVGVMFINNSQEEQLNNASGYINNFIEKFKSVQNLDNMNLFKNSVLQNLILAVLLWFLGTTVIRNTYSYGSYSI